MSRFRGWIQAAATLLTNIHLPNFFKGGIYQGKGKTVCVPGLNCYSCPAASGACPIGAFQAVVGSSKFRFSYYITGILILLGVLLGRFICGFLCPFGWLQELLHKIPGKKLSTKKLRPLTYLKYVILLLAVVLLPALIVNDVGMGDPYFCKYICPQGVLEGAIPLAAANESIRAALGALFTRKLIILIAVVVLSVLFFRPFCKWICPLGAFYALMNKVSLLGIQVDTGKCISCGKCLQSCPFGAIVERSQMVDVLKLINETDKQVVAMLAPAIVGQFPGDIGNVVGALKKAGFSDVIEVAVGADITTKKEAAEFIEKMENGEKLMTTSCCPAYFRAAQVHIPEIQPYVSHTKTPMYYTAELVKKEHPDCVAVFIGPCLAKRVEAEYDPNVDYVLTFEELGAMLVAAGINIDECEPAEFTAVSYAQGRQFPLTGGVSGAVASIIGDKAEVKAERIDGLSKENIKLLKRYGAKGCENNMLEVMCCEGGCISGPGCIALPKKASRAVEAYVAKGEDLNNEK